MITIYNCGRQFKGKSLINTLNDYVVLDIETTGLDPFFDEIIEIGAIKVINGECVANFSKLVKPSKPVSDFIVQLTGITNDMLRDSPSIDKVLPEFMEFVSDMTIIGHNVHFDINFIYDNSMQVLNKPFFNDFIDTLRLSRRLFTSLDNHKLDTVCAFLNIDAVDHHRALQDCQITQNVYEEIKRYLVNNKIELQELFAPKKSEKLKARNITTDNIEFDENHLFYKKNCVFTGALQIVRKQAMQIVADLGGFCQDNVTKDTNFFILGNYDYSSNEKSSKHKKAEKYIVQGQDIRILSENVFMDLIADKLKK